MDPDLGVLDTFKPSEPILAKAAMEHSCGGGNWKRSIRSLTSELLEKGLVEKGLKGELFARLLLLTHYNVRAALQLSPQQPKFDILISCHLGDGKIEEGNITVMAIQVENKQTQTQITV